MISPSWVLGCGVAAADLFFTKEKPLIFFLDNYRFAEATKFALHRTFVIQSTATH